MGSTMLSTEERLAAVRERAREIEARRRKRRGRVIAVSAVGAGLLTIVGLSFLIPALLTNAPPADYARPEATASVFEVSSCVGYILIGVLAFALGVAMTIFFYRVQVSHKNDQGENDD